MKKINVLAFLLLLFTLLPIVGADDALIDVQISIVPEPLALYNKTLLKSGKVYFITVAVTNKNLHISTGDVVDPSNPGSTYTGELVIGVRESLGRHYSYSWANAEGAGGVGGWEIASAWEGPTGYIPIPDIGQTESFTFNFTCEEYRDYASVLVWLSRTIHVRVDSLSTETILPEGEGFGIWVELTTLEDLLYQEQLDFHVLNAHKREYEELMKETEDFSRMIEEEQIAETNDLKIQIQEYESDLQRYEILYKERGTVLSGYEVELQTTKGELDIALQRKRILIIALIGSCFLNICFVAHLTYRRVFPK